MKDSEGLVKDFAVWILFRRQWGYTCGLKERVANFCKASHGTCRRPLQFPDSAIVAKEEATEKT